MSGFPVHLDLSEYFSDLRKYSSVFVNNSKCKTVGDVEDHIKSLFGLDENVCLVHKKFLIPKSEDIQILQQYDIYKVQKCNFHDAQIHKTKKENSLSTSCDQKALNLTQSEKTIDLSCRPKQRLKGTICPSQCVPGTPSLSTDGRGGKSYCEVSPNYVITNGNNASKEKSKHKKKRYVPDSDSDDDENILDMSVNNSKRNKHSNCFSTDDASLYSDCINDFQRDVTRDHPKKPKKKKKHDEMEEPSLNLALPCRESLVNSDSSKEHFSKKRHKKCREDQSNGYLSDNMQESTKYEQNSTVGFENNNSQDENVVRKKHKHSRRSNEAKFYDDFETDQYSCISSFTSKDINSNKATYGKSHDDGNKCNSISQPCNSLEEKKKKMELEVDKMIATAIEHSLDTGLSCKDHENSSDLSSGLSRPNSNIKEDNGDEEMSITENTFEESHSEGNFKRKRRRKHNKKKKKERLMQMLAIGPILNQLAVEHPVPKLSPRSECAKHVFFSEEDFAEDTNVPSTPNQKSQTESSVPCTTYNEVPPPEEKSDTSWKDSLLRLASGSKPMVFHRNTSVPTDNKPSLDPSTSVEKSQKDSISLESKAQEKPVVEVAASCREADESNSDRRSEQSQSADKLSDLLKPLPTPDRLKDINLSNYPIIDKVVSGDFILFKVWKFNEQGEAGLSKPILAKVAETTSFPNKISLHVMEGCDECSHYVHSDKSDTNFSIELQWTDINEPRLFYP